MKTFKDDRTVNQLKTHTILVTATDKFLSGWGDATGGLSKCAWACENWEQADKIYNWVKNRSDMKYVNISTNWKPKNYKHVHIYVVDETHPGLK